jgi:hypothetical protein
MASCIASAQKAHEWVVLEHDDHVIGFACGHVFNRLPSFKWSAETVGGDHHRAGQLADTNFWISVMEAQADLPPGARIQPNPPGPPTA